MKKIEHIGIAVRDIDEAEKRFSKLLNALSYKREAVESEGVLTSFFQLGETKIELLAATNARSPIHKFIEKKGEGIHHIAFEVEDIFQSIDRMQDEGFRFINPQPKDGADNKRIAFIHPKSTGGILVELCEEKK